MNTTESNTFLAVFEELKAIFHSSPKNIVITAHKNPDGDAIGASLALVHYLRSLGHQATAVMPNDYPDFLHWLAGHDEVLVFDKMRKLARGKIEEADVLIAVDYNAPSRIGSMEENFVESKAQKIMIDHHLNPESFTDISYSRPDVGSSCELIYHIIEGLDDLDTLNKDIATCIYTGIMTDTGSFRFASTTSKTHEIAAQLLRYNIQHHLIHQNVYDQNPIDRLRLIGYALSEKMELWAEDSVAVFALNKKELLKHGAKKGYTEGLVNYGLSIGTVELSIFLKEEQGNIKLSFRSKGDFPANELASQHFNGGGHLNAAGGILKGRIDELMPEIKKNVISFYTKIRS